MRRSSDSDGSSRERADHRLDDLVRAAASAARDPHPSTEELVALDEDRLRPERRAEVLEHVCGCAECAGLVRALDDPDSAGGSDGQPLPAPPPLRGAARRDAAVRALGLALAATVAVAVGLAWWGLGNARELRELSAPQTRVVALSLLPEEREELRAGPEADVFAVPPGVERLVLDLPYAGIEPGEELTVELARNGDVVWSAAGLEANPRGGGFVVIVPAEMLGEDPYEVRLIRGEGPDRRRLATYPLTIVRESG